MEITLNSLLKYASINDFVVTVLWNLVKDDFSKFNFDFIEEKLVEVRQRFLPERFHVVVLEMVPVQVVKHLVKQFRKHAVIIPDFNEGSKT